MVQYIVSSDDQLTETLLARYRDERVGTQTMLARVHGAIRQGLEAEVSFNELIADGGPLADLATYHAAKIAPVTANLDALRALMVQVQQTMEGLEAAVPGLFPGVTVQ